MGGFRYEVITEYWPLFLEGAKMTIQITVICVTLGVILGMALGMARLADARHSPWKQILKYCVRWPVTVYVSFFRGTPLFVQILLMQFAILPFFIHPTEGLLISGDLAREIRSTYGAMLAGIVAITLNAGAYLSEVFRAGIQSKWLMTRRLDLAENLLKENKLSIKQISYSVGFKTPAHFSTAFKKRHEMTLSEYRASNTGCN